MSSMSLKNITKLNLLGASLAVITALPANAVEVPGIVNPGQVEKRFENNKPDLSMPDFELPVVSDVGELSAAAKKQLEENKFTLKKIEIEGATVFSADELKFAYEDKIGQKISLLDARSIAKKITEYYRKNGYILSQAVIPAQELQDGVLKIKVVEGYVGSFVIQGDISEGQKEVLSGYAANLIKSKPIRTQDMERYLLLMNDLPGAKVKGLLRPSTSQFGAAELVLKVEDKAFAGSYNINNRGSEYIGPWQHTLSGSANSLMGMYDQTNVRFSTTNPTTEMRSYEIQHGHVIGDEGLKLSGRYSHTHTEPGYTLKPVQIVGDSDLFELKAEYPLVRSRNENLIPRISLEAHDTDTDVFKNVDFTVDRLRVARLGTYYDLHDDFAGYNSFTWVLSQGIDALGASDSGINRSNPIGQPDFTKVNFDASREQGVYGPFSILGALSSQYSANPLYVSEQFSLGGEDFGRAYDPAEVLGDSGIIGKLEMRFDDQVGAEYLEGYQLYGYYDLGRTWSRKVPHAANEKQSIASAGFGVRSNFTENLYGNVELAFPLTKEVSTRSGNDNSPRLFVNFLAQF